MKESKIRISLRSKCDQKEAAARARHAFGGSEICNATRHLNKTTSLPSSLFPGFHHELLHSQQHEHEHGIGLVQPRAKGVARTTIQVRQTELDFENYMRFEK